MVICIIYKARVNERKGKERKKEGNGKENGFYISKSKFFFLNLTTHIQPPLPKEWAGTPNETNLGSLS
jgi:hypothetical protein